MQTMTVQEIREKFVKYFESNGHEKLPSSSLIPVNDPSVLITTAGMQQFKKWFSGEEKPEYPRTVTIQKCVRTNDIEEIGDEYHLTFFEMLGNFSFGDYFKEGAIKWGLDFVENELKVPRDRIWVSIFAGDDQTPRDDDSERIWKSLGITDIREHNREDNFWGPTGTEGACGPTSEIYVDDVEVWNLVFNEYYQQPDGVLIPLESKGVDTGAGLERLTATINKLPSVFETDELAQIMALVKEKMAKEDQKAQRIITDHLRSAVFLLADGVRPSNLDRGYVLRRLIRRAVRYGHLTGIEQNMCSKIGEKVIAIYGGNYPNLKTEKDSILTELEVEEAKFRKVIEDGLKKLKSKEKITGEEAFSLFATNGFPFELTLEIAKEEGIKLEDDIQAKFEQEFEKHQEVSRGGLEKKFAGGLDDPNDPQNVKYHTSAHLLNAALRDVLGEHVHQKGSNINVERVRFDFTHPAKMTDEEKKAVEELVNKWIAENLKVYRTETDPETAKESGALGEFGQKYGNNVSVYTIGGPLESDAAVSKEICGGPHVKNTGELGHFRIKKEESSSAGVRRIKGILE
jgi:alanyl-tRNA synthetase